MKRSCGPPSALAVGSGSRSCSHDGEILVSLSNSRGKSRANVNAVLAIFALEVASDFVELRKPLAAAARRARTKKLGLWGKDRDESGVDFSDQAAL